MLYYLDYEWSVYMKSKYINYIPKCLLDDFVSNKVVPFVGAGFSKNADIPEGMDMKDWNQLGEAIKEYIPEYKCTSPIDALSNFESEFSRSKLIEVIARELNISKVKPSLTYKAFVNLFFNKICTTNFDFLLEDALVESKIPHSVIVEESRLSISLKETTSLIKVHGDFNHPDKMVITENDYDSYIEKNKLMCTYISNLFITNTILLIGYSFEDNDMRGIWQILNKNLGGLKRVAYCIMVNADKSDIVRFERRNVKVINIIDNKKKYPEILKVLFEEIKQYKDDKISKSLIATDDDVASELVIPVKERRLCFLSSTIKRIAILRKLLVPIINAKDYEIITENDVILPNDNIMEKVEAIIKKCSLVIVDITEKSVFVELENEIAKKYKKDIIILCDENKKNIDSGLDKDVVYYEENDEDGKLAKNIQKRLRSKQYNSSDVDKLLREKQNDAAVLICFRDLEEKLRNYCEDNYCEFKSYNIRIKKNRINGFRYKNITLLPMLKFYAFKNKKVSEDEVLEINRLRNEIVHGIKKLDEGGAKDIMEKIRIIINDIDKMNEKDKD